MPFGSYRSREQYGNRRMAARLVNHLKPYEEGTLYDTVTEAEAALATMLERAKQKGMVTETEEKEDGPWHTISDQEGHLLGIFYVAID